MEQARVTPVHKGGDKTIMNNYRPISTLPVLSKVIERVVHNQLSYHLETNASLPPQQSGFRHVFSTMSLLLNITTNWMRAIDGGCYVGAMFLELRKAFDTVDHEILLSKLAGVGMKGMHVPLYQRVCSLIPPKCMYQILRFINIILDKAVECTCHVLEHAEMIISLLGCCLMELTL